jgi:hypothetical protein
VGQAAVSDGQLFDRFPFREDGLASPEVDVGGGQIAQALVMTVMVVVLDEGGDGGLKLAREEVVLEQDLVLHSLVPALDLALQVWGWFGAPRTCRMPLSSSHSAKLPAT